MRTREDWSARKPPGTKTVESGDAMPFCMFDIGSGMILVLFYLGYSLRQQSASDVLFSATGHRGPGAPKNKTESLRVRGAEDSHGSRSRFFGLLVFLMVWSQGRSSSQQGPHR